LTPRGLGSVYLILNMISRAKNWVVNTCWDWFSMEKLQQKSRLFAVVLGITLLLSIIAIIGLIFAYIDIHVWSREGHVILVPEERIVQINGRHYIPIKIV
jgi:hypothetical protein